MDERVFPSLFLVRAMKSGSTSLHDAIGMHPQIWMTSYKEPQCFAGSLDAEQGWFDSNPLPGPEGHWYFALFDKARDDPNVLYSGESVPPSKGALNESETSIRKLEFSVF